MARAKDRGADRLTRALKERDEALAFQAATDEILTAISRSSSDAKPVFDAIVRNVPRLFGTRYVAVFLVKGEELHLAASRAEADFERRHGPVFRRFRESFPQPIDWRGFTGKALRSGKVSQIAPIIGNPKATPQALQLAKEFGYNAMLVAPLVRDGKTIGAIGTTRAEAKLFEARELALFKRFADQAVIAIENARLFNETKEALEQQTATSQILGVISSSPTDLAPVFDAILASAMQLCEAHLGIFNLYDGEWLRTVAQRGGNPQFAQWLLERGAIKPDGGMTYQAISERRAVQIADVREAPGYREGKPNISKFVDLGGVRTFLAVPLLKEGAVIGTIGIYRPEVRPFTDKQIALASTFANQAVIAIVNARLFNETKEALERQTATAEILKVISGSPTATQPVFESIVQKCHALYQDSRVALLLIDDGRLVTRASTGYVFEPMPIDRESGLGACVLEGRTIHLPDLEAAAEQYPRLRQLGIKHGYRSGMYAPLMREGRAVGGISVLRRAAGAFSEKDVALLTTFADQAVIAIENARLFNETKEALERQTATAEILRVIASSPTDVQPVLDAIAERAAVLCGAPNANVLLKDGDVLRTLAGFYRDIGGVAPDRTTTVPLRRETVNGRAFLDRKVVHHADALPLLDTEYPESGDLVRRFGIRSQLVVPLVTEGDALGTISIWRREARPFSSDEIALVQTFADQAVIAIENARLFNETKQALERQTATAEILKVISSTPTDVQPVFDVIVRSALRLLEGHSAAVTRVEGDIEHLGAYTSTSASGDEQLRSMYPRLVSHSGAGKRAILTAKPSMTVDYESDPTIPESSRETARLRGVGAASSSRCCARERSSERFASRAGLRVLFRITT